MIDNLGPSESKEFFDKTLASLMHLHKSGNLLKLHPLEKELLIHTLKVLLKDLNEESINADAISKGTNDSDEISSLKVDLPTTLSGLASGDFNLALINDDNSEKKTAVLRVILAIILRTGRPVKVAAIEAELKALGIIINNTALRNHLSSFVNKKRLENIGRGLYDEFREPAGSNVLKMTVDRTV